MKPARVWAVITWFVTGTFLFWLSTSGGQYKTVSSCIGSYLFAGIFGLGVHQAIVNRVSKEDRARRRAARKAAFAESVDKFTKALSQLFAYLLVVAVLACIIWGLLPDSTTDTLRYKWLYNLADNNVNILSKPHDCDFDKAPLGNKECHFEKQVILFHANGNNDSSVTGVEIIWNKVASK